MSEVVKAEVTDSDGNADYSRRRVVTGVAWSLPVIMTAIAAPAAAASPSVTAALVGVGSAVTFVSSTGIGTSRNGTGPTALQIQNAGGAVSGTISGTINITPFGTVLVGAGVESMSPAAVGAPSYSLDHSYNATFTYTAGIASGQTLRFPIQFQYQFVSLPPGTGTVYSYQMTMTVTLPDTTTQTLTAGLTITF